MFVDIQIIRRLEIEIFYNIAIKVNRNIKEKRRYTLKPKLIKKAKLKRRYKCAIQYNLLHTVFFSTWTQGVKDANIQKPKFRRHTCEN